MVYHFVMYAWDRGRGDLNFVNEIVSIGARMLENRFGKMVAENDNNWVRICDEA